MIGQINPEYIRTRPAKLYSRLMSYLFFEGRPVTTPGQWINPLVFKILNFAQKRELGNNVKEPVFILGTGRSGTTILGIVMSMHSDVAFLNEPKALWNSVFPDEDLIGSYSRGDARYELFADDADEEQIKRIRNIYGFYLSTVFSTRALDKYPELLFRIELVKKIFPDFKALFLYRNGWDTCLSSANWSDINSEQVNDEMHDWWGVNNRKWNFMVDQLVAKDDDLKAHVNEIRGFTNQVDMSIVEWIISMKKGLEMCEKYPQHIMPVRYEELASTPLKVIKEICKFCDLKNDKKLFSYAAQILKTVPSKNPVALHPVLEKPFNELMKKLNY
ncbi:MAG: sulfotransferase [Bacteroidia bacterium]